MSNNPNIKTKGLYISIPGTMSYHIRGASAEGKHGTGAKVTESVKVCRWTSGTSYLTLKYIRFKISDPKGIDNAIAKAKKIAFDLVSGKIKEEDLRPKKKKLSWNSK